MVSENYKHATAIRPVTKLTTLLALIALLAACGGNLKNKNPIDGGKPGQNSSNPDDANKVGIGGTCDNEKKCVSTANCEGGVCVEKGQEEQPVTPKSCTPTSNDCESNEVCISNQCIAKSDICRVKNVQCPNENYKCIEGACVPQCAPSELCGGTCCASSETCLNNKCITPPAKKSGDGDSLCELAPNQPKYCAKDEDCFGNPSDGYSCVKVSDYTCDLDKEILCKLSEYCDPGPQRCVNYDSNPVLCKEDIEFDGNIKEILTWNQSSSSPNYTHVMATPVVANVFDNNRDGKIDEKDTSEIIFSSFSKNPGYTTYGVLRVISGKPNPSDRYNVDEIFSSTTIAPSADVRPFWTSSSFAPAVADLNNDGKPAIISDAFFPSGTFDSNSPTPSAGGMNKATDRHLVAITGDGKRFLFDVPIRNLNIWEQNPLISVANVDGKGGPEIAVGQYLLDNHGQTLCDLTTLPGLANSGIMITNIADLDGDGVQELVATGSFLDSSRFKPGLFFIKYNPNAAATANKCSLVSKVDEQVAGVAIADMDGDKSPDIIYNYEGTIRVLKFPLDSTKQGYIWSKDIPITSSAKSSHSCGNDIHSYSNYQCQTGIAVPVVADFNRDGKPEVGVAGRWYYVLMDNANGDILWAKKTVDSSSAKTSSSVFDFNGDGKAEVVYNDQGTLYVFSGDGTQTDADGDSFNDADVKLQISNPTATLREYPVIADVNHDGHANIVVGANYSDSIHGIRVFQDSKNRWVPTRQIWNQFSYHVTNVNKDATIPVHEEPNWKKPWLNNYFQNVQAGNPLLAPNVRPVVREISSASCNSSNAREKRIVFDIQNDGSNDVPPNEANYKIVATNGSKRHVIKDGTNKTLIRPTQSETIVVDSWTIPDDLANQPFQVKIILNDKKSLRECDYKNNTIVVNDVQVASPNLVATFSIDTTECLSDKVKINYIVKNKGGLPVNANTAKVTIYTGLLSAQSSATLAATIPINQKLEVDGSFSGTYEWTVPNEFINQPLFIKVVADEANTIIECNEQDNAADNANDATETACYHYG